MAGNEFVRAMSVEDVARLRAVLRWAHRHGIRRVPGSPKTWMAPDRSIVVLQIGGSGLAVTRPGSPICLIGVSTVAETVSMLAALGALPARFSNLGADALGEHITVCDRYVEHLMREHRGELSDPVIGAWVSAWIAAADSARSLAQVA